MSTKKKKGSKTNGEEVPLFAEGTPLDDLGLPLSDVEIDEEDARDMPLDAEGARQAQQFRQAASKKAAGGKRVTFNGPDPDKYNLAVQINPQARVRIFQREPEPDHRWPERYVSELKTYEALRAHVVDHMWNGERAVFRWEVHGGKGFTYASGSIPLREDEMRKYPQQQPPQYPYQPAPPYGMQPLPGYAPPPAQYAPPPAQYAPPPAQYAQPQPQPQQQPQAPPPPPVQVMPQIQIPPGLDPTVAALITTLLAQLNDANNRGAQLAAQLTQQYYAPQQFAAPQVSVAPAPPPSPPKGPLEQLQEMSAMVEGMNTIQKRIAQQFSSDEPEVDPTPAPPPGDPDFPWKMKDFGPVRMVATADGEVSAPVLANLDKYEGLFDGLLGRVKKLFNDISDDRMKHMREQLSIMREAEAINNRTQQRALPPQQQAPQVPQQQAPQQQYASPPSHQQYASPPRQHAPPREEVDASTGAQQELQHPWEKFRRRVDAEPEAPAAAETPPEPPPNPPEVVEAAAEVADVAAFEAPRG